MMMNNMNNLAKDNVERCSELSRKLSEDITIFNSSDLNEVQQTFFLARSTLSNFFKSRSIEPSFDFLLNHLKITLENCNNLLMEMKQLKLEFVKWPNHTKISLFKLDYLIKQQIDQIHFEFITNKDNAPVAGLSDPTARKFWIENFGANIRLVPYHEFLTHFKNVLQLNDISEEKMKIGFLYLDFTRDEWISIYELEIFIQLFGPFQGCFQRLLEPYEKGMLCGFIPAAEANQILRQKIAGSYLVRFSKSKPGCFAITFVDARENIKHCLLYSLRPSGLTLKQPPTVYSSLMEFVVAHQFKLIHPVGKESSDKDDLAQLDFSRYQNLNFSNNNLQFNNNNNNQNYVNNNVNLNTNNNNVNNFNNNNNNVNRFGSTTHTYENSNLNNSPLGHSPYPLPNQQPLKLNPFDSNFNYPPTKEQITQQNNFNNPNNINNNNNSNNNNLNYNNQFNRPNNPVNNSSFPQSDMFNPKILPQHSPSNSNNPNGFVYYREDEKNVIGTCVICYDAKRDALIMNCKHLVCCMKCSKELKECPICRSPIQNIIQLFAV